MFWLQQQILWLINNELFCNYSGFQIGQPQISLRAKHDRIQSLLLTDKYLRSCFAPTKSSVVYSTENRCNELREI